MGIRWLVVATLLAGTPSLVADERVAVRGRVLDAVSGLPITTAEVTAGSARATTDAGGAFEVALAPGPWTLTILAPGYLEQTRRLTVGAVPPTSIDIALVPKARFSEHLEVKASPAAPAPPGALPVTPERVLTVAGGLDNIFHVIQTLPGVVATDELAAGSPCAAALPTRT